MDIPPWLKLRYPDLLGSPLVPHSVSCPKFPPPPSLECLTSPSCNTLAMTISGGRPTLPQWRGRSWHCCMAKVDKKIDKKLERLVGMGVCVITTRLLSHAIGFSGGQFIRSRFVLVKDFYAKKIRQTIACLIFLKEREKYRT